MSEWKKGKKKETWRKRNRRGGKIEGLKASKETSVERKLEEKQEDNLGRERNECTNRVGERARRSKGTGMKRKKEGSRRKGRACRLGGKEKGREIIM